MLLPVRWGVERGATPSTPSSCTDIYWRSPNGGIHPTGCIPVAEIGKFTDLGAFSGW